MVRQRHDLVQGLGAWSSAAIVVGTMIGTGIFIVPADMARGAGTIPLVIAVWIAGGALSLFGAFAYAELGAALPEAGGEYVYLSRAYGQKWGFLFGWMHSILGRPTSAATIAAGLLRFCGFLFPALAAPIFTHTFALPSVMRPYTFAVAWAQPCAVAAIALITFVNYLGVRLAGQIQVALTFIKISVVLAVIGVAFSLGPTHIDFPQTHAVVPASWTGFFAAMVAALWAYDGWSDVNLVASEVKDPRRNIPRALVGGVVLVAALYIAITLACFCVLPFSSVAASSHIASDVVASVTGGAAAKWLTIAMIICALGTLNSSILTGARVDFAMARDGFFFQIAGGVHPKYRTPARALIFQACLASLLALTGTFEELYTLFIFATWIFYALATMAVLRLRWKEPNLPRPYRTWGYPVVPVLFVIGALALTVSLFWANPIRCSIGLAIILFGLVFYARWERIRTAAALTPTSVST